MALSRFDSWLRSPLGPAAVGAQVYICGQPANTINIPPSPQAQLYADPAGTIPVAQPLIADGFGHVAAYVASGTYTTVSVYAAMVALVLPDQEIGAGGLTLPQTFVGVSHEFLTSYDSTTGAFQAAQPAFTDISGSATGLQQQTMVGDSGTGGIQGSVPAPAPGDAPLKFLCADGTWQVPAGSGVGLTSVGLSTNSPFLTVGSSPLTSNGTITLNLTTGLTQNQVLATPNGSSGTVGLRALVAADIPSLPASQITSGLLALAQGGNTFSLLGDLIFGGTAAAPTVLSGNVTTAKQFLSQTGTGSVSAAPTWSALSLSDLPANIPNSALAHSSLTINGDGVLLSASAPGTVSLGATGTIALLTQTKNTVFAGPASGSNAAPTFRALVAADIPTRTVTLNYCIDGGGAVPTTSQAYGQIDIPVAMTITSVVVTADQSGSCQLDLKTCTNASFPGSLTSIVASDPPKLASAQISTDSTLTGWTTSLAANSQLQFYLTSATTVTRINITLVCSVAYA